MLLSKLKDLGAKVKGIEPGIHGQEGGNRYNIDIVHDFFPSKFITEKFDVIIMSNVFRAYRKPCFIFKKIAFLS